MSVADDRVARLILWLVPTATVVVGCGLSLLPRHVIIELVNIVLVWLSLSLPIGVLAGHCILNETNTCRHG
jgi:hypothetical protein